MADGDEVQRQAWSKRDLGPSAKSEKESGTQTWQMGPNSGYRCSAVFCPGPAAGPMVTACDSKIQKAWTWAQAPSHNEAT